MLPFRPFWGPKAISHPLAALALLVLLPVEAAAFGYDEALQGDIDSPLEQPPIFPLDLGSNVVSGSRSDGAARDLDLFAFVVPDGSRLESIRLDYEITEREGNWEFLVVLFDVWTYPTHDLPWSITGRRLGGAGHPILSDGSDPMFEPEASPIVLDLRASDIFSVFPRNGPSLFPIGSGRYVLSSGSASRGGASSLARWDYTLTFSVVPVPEPGTALLVGIGLGMLARRRRR